MQPSTYTSTNTLEYDQGLRSYFLSIFNYMTLALAISGLVSAYIAYNTTLSALIWGTSFKWIAIFSPLAFSLGIAFFYEKMNSHTAKILLFAFAATMGMSLSSIFLVFKLGSIVNVFFITAATFGATAIYGYTTKRDLSRIGSFLIMGVIGIIIAGVVNLFLQSSIMTTVISLLAVVIFTGLTAYDMQNLKTVYNETSGEAREKAGVFGALSLYINFINIFISLLQLLGEKKE
jgi:FtsH-binding integral membrane protein